MKLKHKVAIVTGGGSGIGQAIVDAFVNNGAHVHLLDLSLSDENKISRDFHQCDVSNQLDVENVINQIWSKHPIDILVNNAGIAHIGNLLQTEEQDMDKLYNVNIKGVYNCLRSCVKRMSENGGGVILNMASVAASVGIPDRFAYSMTKGAVVTMTYSVAKDFVDKNIRCNCISPARIHTPFVDGYLSTNYPGQEKEMFDKLSKTQPIGRMGEPEEVANLATFLCSHEAGFITGTDYPIDGGFLKLNV